jgi:formyltetrahydrofolate-dependent phosphoribosylglycinamide formyltransferase
LRLAVFASGGGSNLQALIDTFRDRPDIRLSLVISDRPKAGALVRARDAHIETLVVPVAERPADLVARELLAALDGADVDLILLAGYLRLVPAAVVRHYRQRIVNIHPALLPAFGGKGMFGLHVHRAVLASGATVSGATVHLVDECYDQGKILAQWPVPVLAGDSPETLANRVLNVEHMLYPATVEAFARKLEQGGSAARFSGPGTAAAFAYRLEQRPELADIRRALGLD